MLIFSRAYEPQEMFSPPEYTPTVILFSVKGLRCIALLELNSQGLAWFWEFTAIGVRILKSPSRLTVSVHEHEDDKAYPIHHNDAISLLALIDQSQLYNYATHVWLGILVLAWSMRESSCEEITTTCLCIRSWFLIHTHNSWTSRFVDCLSQWMISVFQGFWQAVPEQFAFPTLPYPLPYAGSLFLRQSLEVVFFHLREFLVTQKIAELLLKTIVDALEQQI